MTQEQFDKQEWGVNMKCNYDNLIRDIISVDFQERLVGLSEPQSENIQWVRCENVELYEKQDTYNDK
jgi:hypothetical protein